MARVLIRGGTIISMDKRVRDLTRGDVLIDKDKIATVLVNLSASAAAVDLQFFAIEPSAPLLVTLKRGEIALYDNDVKPDAAKGNRVSVALADSKAGETIRLMIKTADGKELIATEAQTR